ncbi:hypothetical protein T439DRAFT_376848 [Meredithblackwellia eburnea MCA 4105]
MDLSVEDYTTRDPTQAISSISTTTTKTETEMGSARDGSTGMLKKRLKSCAPCRIRRVKCERPGDGTGDCLKCIEKALVCTPMPTKTPKHAARTGKRIDQARATFGSKVDPSRDPALVPSAALNPSATSSSPPTKPPLTTSSTSGDPLLARLQLGQSNTASGNSPPPSVLPGTTALDRRLAASELQGAVMAGLIDYFVTTQPPIPFIEDTNLRTTFDLAGRRIEALDKGSQVLFRLILSLGARTSPHPLLIGSSSSSSSSSTSPNPNPNSKSPPTTPEELSQATREGRDLREFGRRRDKLCEGLEDSALELVDRMGTLRVASLENMASLLLLESMVEQDDQAHSSARSFVTAYNSHARTLLEQQGPGGGGGAGLRGTSLGWVAFLRDALKSAGSGHSPMLSDDDVYLLRKGMMKPLSLKDALRVFGPPERGGAQQQQQQNVMSGGGGGNASGGNGNLGEADLFWALLAAFTTDLGDFARTVAANLTGVKARLAPLINESFVSSMLDFLDLCYDALPVLEWRATLFEPENPRRSKEDVRATLRAMRFSVAQLTMRLNRSVGERISARWEQPSPEDSTGIVGEEGVESPPEDDQYWERLVELRKETYNRAFLSARDILHVMGDAMENGLPLGSTEWVDSRAAQVLFSTLPAWLSLIVDTPTEEEGGPQDFTFDVKVQDLTWAKKALYSIGWAREKLARPVVWVEEQLAELEQRRAAFWAERAPFSGFGANGLVGGHSYSGSSTSTIPSPESMSSDGAVPMTGTTSTAAPDLSSLFDFVGASGGPIPSPPLPTSTTISSATLNQQSTFGLNPSVLNGSGVVPPSSSSQSHAPAQNLDFANFDLSFLNPSGSGGTGDPTAGLPIDMVGNMSQYTDEEIKMILEAATMDLEGLEDADFAGFGAAEEMVGLEGLLGQAEAAGFGRGMGMGMGMGNGVGNVA